MATIINGKDVAASVIDQIKSATGELQGSAGVQPGLAVVLVGSRSRQPGLCRIQVQDGEGMRLQVGPAFAA